MRYLAVIPFALLSFFNLSKAVTVSTDPVGFITLDLPPEQMTAVSIPMLNSSLHSGVIYEVNGSTVIDNNATWASDQFATKDSNLNPTHYIEITDHTDNTQVGAIYEIIESDGDAKSLTIGDDATALNGASYTIRKFRSLSEVFGESETSELSSGSSSDADIIYKIGAGGQWEIYYIQVAPVFAGGNGWRKLGDIRTDASDVSIFPDEALIIKRRSAGEVKMTLTGSVKTSPSKTPITRGFNLVSLSYPVDVTLSDSNLLQADDPDGLLGLKSGSTTDADRIYIIDDGTFKIYYYQVAPIFAGGNGWRALGDIRTDAAGTTISAGQGVVLKRNSDQGFIWKTDKPF